ncbi:CDP-glycerol:glycerophosphate glycerophosphotransferase [Streptomyces armeniacus]|uniref:CDP-glycerol:glycerophosphate glycerophosphotransferase n=1 Tax=Streptomyces armeniacus TaxID=83291 RepID=A0A345XXJ1_9ACTN|nr:bifunctional glycosyltransferase family 2 protein/CDP-glycerol:glycerophosphate glycerophosphotransferase [Streptomyces armeniacus]AXK36357.1 CDP-glycerol:glycerophosphate glycerophosphotransferase [Streptomyces armeniacus]
MSPRLTVVVPVRNAGPHLPECLRSLAAQTMGDLEVILVDDPRVSSPADGAPADGQLAPALEFAEGDDRFRVVRLAADETADARAAGTRHADSGSTYLAFADGADTVPPRAYELLLGTLDETGSDFATGGILRLGTDDSGQPLLSPYGPVKKATAKNRPRTHLNQHRPLIHDRTVRNKVFRRTFWDWLDLGWPAGVAGEGALAPDTAVALPAHYLATSVDVLSDAVCHWREPGDGHTPRPRTDPGALRDAMTVADGVSRLLGGWTSDARQGAKADYDATALTGDLMPFMKELPGAGEEFRALFAELAADFVSRVTTDVFEGLPVAARMKWELARTGRMADLLDALAFERDNPRVFRVTGARARGAAFLRPDGSEIDVPRRLARPAKDDLPLIARLQECRWLPDGTLRLRGYAYVRSLDAEHPRQSRKIGWLRRRGSRMRTPVRVRTVPAPEATSYSRQRLHSYDSSGFEITVDPARLLKALGRDERTGVWTLGLGVLTGGLLRHAGVGPGGDGSGKQPLALETGDGRRIVPVFRHGQLRISVEEIGARLTGHRMEGGELELTGTVREGRKPATMVLRTGHGEAETSREYPVRTVRTEADGRDVFTIRVPLADLAAAGTAQSAAHGDDTDDADITDNSSSTDNGDNGDNGERATEDGANGADPAAPADPADPADTADTADTAAADTADGPRPAEADAAAETATPAPVPAPSHTWRASLVFKDSSQCRIVAPEDTALGRYPLTGDGTFRELCLTPDASGHLVLTDRAVQPVADALAWSPDGELTVSGTFPEAPEGVRAAAAVELIWQHSGHREEVAVPVERDGGRFTARLRPEDAAPGGLPLRQGRWYPFFRALGADTRDGDVPLRLRPALLGTLPETYAGERDFTLERRFHDRLFLLSGSVLGVRERGTYRQHQLQTVLYPAARRRPLRDAVLYNSFDGRQFSDSPRALHEELLRRGTEVEHLWAVRDGQALVPPGARAVVQGSAEWHEALARSRWLVGNTHFPRWFERREGQTAVQTWHGTPLKRIGLDLADMTFANHEYLASLTERSAQWSLLLSPNRFSTPILRRAFGYEGEILESGYPRNDLLYAEDRDKHAREVRKRLDIPEDKRIVLYAPTWRDDNRFDRSNCKFDLRLDLDAAHAALGADHVLLVRKHYLVADAVPGTGDGFVRDVSAWPDIAELLLISDVLITDYSSLMFDFAHTGRPILFFTYDLERYRDVLRGFYFDFEERAPGPLLARSDEVIAALTDADAVAAAHEERYAQFRQAFCDLDDGQAAARVVDRMLAGRGEPAATAAPAAAPVPPAQQQAPAPEGPENAEPAAGSAAGSATAAD